MAALQNSTTFPQTRRKRPRLPPGPVVGNMPELRRLYQEADDQENNKPSSSSGPGRFSHDVVRKLVPYYHKWTGMYGSNFLYWRGMNPTLMVSEPEMIKEVLVKTGGGSFDKISFNPLTKQLFGQGLNGLAGHTWALHRRIATQAFTILRVKVTKRPHQAMEGSEAIHAKVGLKMEVCVK